MAVYRDIDSDVRINGSLTLPTGSITIGGVNIIDALADKVNASRTITAGAGLTGGGNLTANRTISVSFGTSAGTVAEGNHGHPIADVTGLQTALDNKSDDGHVHTFASLTSKPTTLAGYGITDASEEGHVHTFTSLTGKPTTLAGYGITDAAPLNHNHSGTYLPVAGKAADSDKLDGNDSSHFATASALSTHTSSSSIHKNWGNWDTNGGQDLRVHSKRAVVGTTGTTPTLYLNYGADFAGGVYVYGPLKQDGNQVWHAGNLKLSDFLTTNAVATVVSNFTVAGRQWVGQTGNTGSVVLRNGSGVNAIYLDAGGAGTISNHKIYLNGADGSAVYAGNVRVGSLTVDSTSLVRNLNAEFIGGTKETEFVRTPSIRDIRGYGVHSGLEVVQKSPTPDMSVEVKPGIVYTDSGRRFEWTATVSLPITEASSNYDRYDIVYVQGSKMKDINNNQIKPSGNNEGIMSVWTGAASNAPTVEYSTFYSQFPDAVILGTVLVRANIGTITDGTGGTFDAIDNAPKRLMNVRLVEGVSYHIDEPTYIDGDIYEKGTKLESKYPRLATANTFSGNQKINGRVHINASGTLGGAATGANYGLRVGADSAYIAMDGNEILSTSDMNFRATNGRMLISGTDGIYLESKVRAPNNAKTLTIPAGQTYVTWTHNYGSSSYAVNPVANSFARHVRWNNKQNNTVTIEIDEAFEQDILVDCILIGY
jgi:hypothetical protein